MNKQKRITFYHIIAFTSIFFLLGTSYNPTALSILHQDEGYILCAPLQSTTTYLINRDGDVQHTWPSTIVPGETAYLLEDGSILRTIKLSYATGGAGGGLQKISADGTLLWDFRYISDNYCSHHDIKPLPNGNVLMLAYEVKTRTEAINAGRNPNNLFGTILRVDHIIEVQPTGPTTGEIVWEWHVWDHLIQDYDPTKANYGTVADHPELIDINFGGSASDWLHTNSIDYHQEFDQILLSVHTFSEIWVIDHSTTTQEAASHSGGNSGKGGDLLYRWGNPAAYRAGTTTNQKFFNQHDATWVEPGYPGEGNILVFNNGCQRPGGSLTTIDEIIPPVNSNGYYYLEPGSSYSPSQQTWIYNTGLYSFFLGGAQRLPTGNTMICIGTLGRCIEVTPEKNIVWEYINPYPTPTRNPLFKVRYYELQPTDTANLDCEGKLDWNSITPGATIQGSFIVQNIGINGSELNWSITSYPEWGTWSFNPEHGENLTPEDGGTTIQVTVTVPNEKNTEFTGTIKIVNDDNNDDFDVIFVYLKTPKTHVLLDILSYILHRLSIRFPFLHFLINYF